MFIFCAPSLPFSNQIMHLILSTFLHRLRSINCAPLLCDIFGGWGIDALEIQSTNYILTWMFPEWEDRAASSSSRNVHVFAFAHVLINVPLLALCKSCGTCFGLNT